MDTSGGEITSPFAILLVVFDRHKRCKLNGSSLMKVEKKYGGRVDKQQQLLLDLKKKYIDIPTSVSSAQLSRILGVYDIPVSFRLHLAQFTIAEYDPSLDIMSSSFDPLKALRLPLCEKRVISTLRDHTSGSTRPRDNMAKLKHLVVLNNGCVSSSSSSSSSSSIEAIAVSSSAYVDLVDSPAIFKTHHQVAKEVHPFERIAIHTLQHGGKNRQESKRSGQLADTANLQEVTKGSTYSLLYHIMKEKSRAHVIIRRRNSVRGHLIGRLVAFDRHFNLIMRNVTEEITNLPEDLGEGADNKIPISMYSGSIRASNDNTSTSTMVSKSCTPHTRDHHDNKSIKVVPFTVVSSNRSISRRQLPQLLVRGDSIVCVYRST